MLHLSVIQAALTEILDDYRTDGLLSQKAWRKKADPNRILLAVNQADIECCGVLKPRGHISIYVPPHTRRVHLDQLPYYSGAYNKQPMEGLSGIPLLQDEAYLDCAEILSTTANARPAAAPDARPQVLAVVGAQHLPHAGQPAVAYEAERRILWLNHEYAQGNFLTVEASLRPRLIDLSASEEKLNEIKKEYRIRTPDYARGWFLLQAQLQLLPGHSEAAQLAQKQADRARMDAISRAPGNPPTVYTPQGPSHYGM